MGGGWAVFSGLFLMQKMQLCIKLWCIGVEPSHILHLCFDLQWKCYLICFKLTRRADSSLERILQSSSISAVHFGAVSAEHFIFILFAVQTILKIRAALQSNKAQLVRHHDDEMHTRHNSFAGTLFKPLCIDGFTTSTDSLLLRKPPKMAILSAHAVSNCVNLAQLVLPFAPLSKQENSRALKRINDCQFSGHWKA